MASILQDLAKMAKEFEAKTGAPPLTKFLATVEKLPDEKRLKLIKEVLVVAERVSQTAPELDQVVSLIREINEMPVEKLERLEKVLRRIEGIMKKAPQELISFLTSLKEE